MTVLPRGTIRFETGTPGSAGHAGFPRDELTADRLTADRFPGDRDTGDRGTGDGFVEVTGCVRAPWPGAGLRSRNSRAGDVMVADFRTAGRLRMPATPQEGELRLYAARRGTWRLDYEGASYPLSAGRFLAYPGIGLSGFEAAARTSGVTVGVPLREMGAAGATPVTGRAGAPEVRLLLAQASMLHDTVGLLTDSGVRAARNALVELARGVVGGYVDDREPALAPALAGAARTIADGRLTHAELTPGLLARELHVSVRTLSRAFAATGEPAAAYIRRRRLEEARRALAAGHTVSEVAARWQFADSSHFIRAFRKRYGQTPGTVTAGNGDGRER